MATYLLEGALGLQEGDDDKKWDTGHGGKSQEPSNGVSPRRVRVDIVVFERCVLAQGEEEGSLKGREGQGETGATESLPWLYQQPRTEKHPTTPRGI